MKINILLPFKEKFDEKKASSVSITIKNNLNHSKYINNIQIFVKRQKTLFLRETFGGLSTLFYH